MRPLPTMKLLKEPGAILSVVFLALATLVTLALHEPAPTSAQVEAVSMKAAQTADPAAEQRLRNWASEGLPVAQRELALLYRGRPGTAQEVRQMFAYAAGKGDAEAAFQLAELERAHGESAKAVSWYTQAAERKHAKAALMLALVLRNGEAGTRDDAGAAKWLALSAGQGNAHAMFLLSNVYNEGRGVPRDPAMGRKLLEEAAEHDYPPALQELAMTVQAGDAFTPKDELRASHLMKEATEHRQNNWNRF